MQLFFLFDLRKQQVLSFGQICVALNRVKSFSNFIIKGAVFPEPVKPNVDIKLEYNRLRSECQDDFESPDFSSVMLLTIKSLSIHKHDLASDTAHVMQSYKPDLVIGDSNLNALVQPIPALILSFKKNI